MRGVALQIDHVTNRFIQECEQSDEYYPLASMERKILRSFVKWIQLHFRIVIVPIDKHMLCPMCGTELKEPVDEEDGDDNHLA
jgi:hypothetical protein